MYYCIWILLLFWDSSPLSIYPPVHILIFACISKRLVICFDATSTFIGVFATFPSVIQVAGCGALARCQSHSLICQEGKEQKKKTYGGIRYCMNECEMEYLPKRLKVCATMSGNRWRCKIAHSKLCLKKKSHVDHLF